MNCLWCNEEMAPEMTWLNIILMPKSKNICPSCFNRLEIIGGERCSICSRMTNEKICRDCEKWGANLAWEGTLTFNHSIFSYNEMMKELIAKWKYRGDYILAEIFKQSIQTAFEETFSFLEKDALILPIPLSKERLRERGFNQAKVLADFLQVTTCEVMTRVHSEKQAKKTRHERIAAKNPFTLNEKVNKTVVLVDDIYTTGATLHHAAKLLKENGCPQVYAFTLIRG